MAAYFAQLPVRSDRSIAVRLVASTAGSERFLGRATDADPDSSLARTLLGARFIVMSWNARGNTSARYVTQAQWRVFYDYLNRAERVLADATAIDPTNAAAWTERVTLARGLDLSLQEGRRRYEKAAEHCDAPYMAQIQMVQHLCPKWGGSITELHAFARDCLHSSKPGSLSGAIVAHAHIEEGFARDSLNESDEHLWHRRVRDELAAAAAQSVLHPNHQSAHGWVNARSVFAYAFFQGSNSAQAAPHFAALGDLADPYPWDQRYLQWKARFRHARKAVASW